MKLKHAKICKGSFGDRRSNRRPMSRLVYDFLNIGVRQTISFSHFFSVAVHDFLQTNQPQTTRRPTPTPFKQFKDQVKASFTPCLLAHYNNRTLSVNAIIISWLRFYARTLIGISFYSFIQCQFRGYSCQFILLD